MRLSRFCVIMGIMLASACASDLSDDPIPYQPFPDYVLNLNLPDNIILRTKGSAKAFGEPGVRGVIVYCADPGVYRVYERNCSFHPNDACATVNIDPSNLYMIDTCCGSTFDFVTGNPIGGAAWRPLMRYDAAYDGVYLTIRDEVL
jgi:hypothetical protein